MSAGKILLGVVAGAAAGAIVGILLAPAKGSTTRMKIVRKGTRYAEDAREQFDKYIDALTAELGALKKGTLGWIDKGTEKAASITSAKHTKRI